MSGKTSSKPVRIGNKLKKEIENSNFKIDLIVRHIRNVQDNCLLLGKKLINLGEIQLGKDIIARGFCHDNSKFFGMEWENINIIPAKSVDVDPIKIKRNISINHHRQTQSHHPESFCGGIKEMPQSSLAEFCCDIKARSEEFGTSLRDWIHDYAMKTWNFNDTDKVYKDIMRFIDLLCEQPFESIPKIE